MTKSFVASYAAAVGLSALLFTGTLVGCNDANQTNPQNKLVGPFTANDSPVVVRGGSLKLREAHKAHWTQSPTTSNVWTLQTDQPPQDLAFSRVAIMPPNTSTPPASGPGSSDLTQNSPNNWTLTFYFRDKNGIATNSPAFQICTANSPTITICSSMPTGALPNPTYLIAVASSGTSLIQEPLDQQPSVKLPLSLETSCSTNVNDFKLCNHVSRINYSSTSSGTSPAAVSVDYWCFYGTCDVGIDK